MEGRDRRGSGIEDADHLAVEAPRRPAPGKVTSTSLIGNPDPPRWYRPAPGKRSLTMRLAGPGEGTDDGDPSPDPVTKQ
jgi:hypothetical protein